MTIIVRVFGDSDCYVVKKCGYDKIKTINKKKV